MLYHKTGKTVKERNAIVTDMLTLGLTQVSTKGHFIGDEHLLFDDGKPGPEPPRDLAAEVTALTEKVAEIDKLREEIRKLKEDN